MGRKFLKVLALMESKGGKIAIGDPDFLAVLGPDAGLPAAYITDIRKRGHRAVKGIRVGRKVVAYELVSSSAAPTDASTVVAPATDVATA